MKDLLLFSGTANANLAAAIAKEAGVNLGACAVERFPDGEISVRLLEPVGRREVFIIQSLSPPVKRSPGRAAHFADACRRAAAKCVTAVIPYFGYARANKRQGRREAITSSMVATCYRPSVLITSSPWTFMRLR